MLLDYCLATLLHGHCFEGVRYGTLSPFVSKFQPNKEYFYPFGLKVYYFFGFPSNRRVAVVCIITSIYHLLCVVVRFSIPTNVFVQIPSG